MMIARVVTAACGFVQVRIVLIHLGQSGLGLWITLTGLLWSATILDGGIGFALQNRMTRHLAAGEIELAAQLTRRAVSCLCAITFLLLAVALPLVWLAPWNTWFGGQHSESAGQLRGALFVVVIAGAVFVPLSISAKIVAARQALWITGMWTTIASVLGLLAVIIVGRTGSSLVAFTAAGCVLPLLPPLMMWFHVGSWRSIRPVATIAPTPPLWRDGAMFLLPQVGAAVTSSLVPALMTIFAGPVAAASFGVLQRLYGFALQIQSMGLAATWPSYTHAAAVGDRSFAQRTYRTTWILTIAGFIVPSLALSPWVPNAVRLWLGPDAPEIPSALLWVTAIWFSAQFCGQPIAVLLNGLGRVRNLAFVSWATIPAALVLADLAGPRAGAVGVVCALLLPYLFLTLPLTAWHASRGLKAITPPARAHV